MPVSTSAWMSGSTSTSVSDSFLCLWSFLHLHLYTTFYIYISSVLKFLSLTMYLYNVIVSINNDMGTCINIYIWTMSILTMMLTYTDICKYVEIHSCIYNHLCLLYVYSWSLCLSRVYAFISASVTMTLATASTSVSTSLSNPCLQSRKTHMCVHPTLSYIDVICIHIIYLCVCTDPYA